MEVKHTTGKQTFKVLRLKKRPDPNAFLSLDEHFEFAAIPFPAVLKEGEVLAKVTHLSCDPTIRIWASEGPQYMEPQKIGDVMRCIGVATVVQSADPNWSQGDFLTGLLGWSEFVIGDPSKRGWTKGMPKDSSPDALLGPLGLNGLTAYFGLFDVAKPCPGDVVLVSGASGATGSAVVQMAKMAGCRVVGIAGGEEKARKVKEFYGADEVIDYKKEDFRMRIRELAPNGYNIYFDNVGGDALEAALDNMAMNARIVICGAIEQYNKASKTGPSNYLMLMIKRASMLGFVVLDFKDRFPEARAKIKKWIQEGKFKFESDVQEGPLTKAPEILNRVFRGDNRGKQIHKLTDSSALLA